MGKENSQGCSRPGWRWTCAPRSTPCFWQSDSRHQRTPVVLANSIQVTFWYQRFTLNDCVSISVTFLGAEENAHVGELGYLSLVGSQAWHISDDRHGFKKEMCPTCQGDVSLGGPATLGELGHLLHHLLLWLVLHGSLRFWTFHPVSQFHRLKPFDGPQCHLKLGFLQQIWSSTGHFESLRSRVKSAALLTSIRPFPSAEKSNEEEVKNWGQVTRDDCVVLVAVPSVRTGITFAGIVRTFQVIAAVVEDVPDFLEIRFSCFCQTFHRCPVSRSRWLNQNSRFLCQLQSPVARRCQILHSPDLLEGGLALPPLRNRRRSRHTQVQMHSPQRFRSLGAWPAGQVPGVGGEKRREACLAEWSTTGRLPLVKLGNVGRLGALYWGPLGKAASQAERNQFDHWVWSPAPLSPTGKQYLSWSFDCITLGHFGNFS